MNILFRILEKCSDSYYNSESFYSLTYEDIQKLSVEEQDIFQKMKNDFSISNVIDDSLFDKLYSLGKEKYPGHEFFKKIGHKVSGYGVEIDLSKNPAGSMDEIKTQAELNRWLLKNKGYVLSSKLDGCSLKLFYKDGKLDIGSTRGDGYIGLDVTRHIKNIKNIPNSIVWENTEYNNCEIRGELIIPKCDIEQCLLELEKTTRKTYKNARNTVSGFLNAKEANQIIQKYLHFVAYWIYPSNECESEKFVTLQELGFEVPRYFEVSSQEIDEDFLIQQVKFVKENDTYECDGIILTIDGEIPKEYQGFETGEKNANPRKSRKFKVGATDNLGETEIVNLEWNISKDGYLKPQIEIQPINLCGVTIQYLTGNNARYVIDNGLSIGAKILIIRSGDVIPKHVETLKAGNGDYNLPTKNYRWNVSEVDYLYTGNEDKFLNAMMIKQLTYSCEALEIEMAKEGNLKKLYNDCFDETGNYLTFLDLVGLTEETIIKVIGKNGAKLYKSLHEKITSVTEPELFDALETFGRGIGKTLLNKVWEAYGRLDVDRNELLALEGFGETVSNQYSSHIADYYLIKERISKLKQITFQEKKLVSTLSDKFKEYNICFTGVRDPYLMKMIIENGGIASESWNKNVNLLIAKDPNSSSGKAQKARELGIKIISLEEAKVLFH